jgi:hypothetical protein
MSQDAKSIQREAVRRLILSAKGWFNEVVTDAAHRCAIQDVLNVFPPDFFDERPPEPIAAKVAHVKAAKQTRGHGCHWPGCTKQCPPAMWGCKTHWFRLPKPIRDRIWATYRAGQEETGDPSVAYVVAATAAQDWIVQHGGAL